jgi:hypothetical protein
LQALWRRLRKWRKSALGTLAQEAKYSLAKCFEARPEESPLFRALLFEWHRIE